MPDREDQALRRWLHADLRYEVVAMGNVRAEVAHHLAPGATVTVTASPTRGMEPTLALAEGLASDGYDAVPHLAARSILGEVHLKETLDRLERAGIRHVFVVGGDAEDPVGPYPDGESLLAAMRDHPHPFAEIGVPGYPEGHPRLDEETLWRSLLAKQTEATYVVTQMCFDAEAMARWTAEARRCGLGLPVVAGIPGAVRWPTLARMSARIGVGDSSRFLRKQSRAVWRLLRPGGYRPTGLVRALAATEQSAEISALHCYTFNQVGAAAAWARRLSG